MPDAQPIARHTTSSVDVLQWPGVGTFLRWRHARVSVQLALLGLAALMVTHGLFGPDLAPANLSTVLTWVHYRGLLVVALLGVGNVFCGGCPFVLVRDVGRRVHAPSRSWPAKLRSKWIAVAMFVAVLFVYELFDLWALPAATAYLVLGYFGAALVIDLVFKGATFCKYVCPVGQFNFIASTVSPLELRVKEAATCQTCRTEDCIAGRHAPGAPEVIVQRGCELGLFLPAKVGNLDCTFCLDCVQACPHDNIALASRTPGFELADARRRSGIGRLDVRRDLAALALLFAFGAMLNALAMVAPVHQLQQWMAVTLGTSSEFIVLGVLFFFGLVVIPALAVVSAAWATGVSSGQAGMLRDVATRYSFAFVPCGFGMWLAHYGFHFLTGALTVIPVAQSAAVDLAGWPLLGEPLWRLSGLRPGAVFPLQLGCIVLGTLGSVAVAHLISEREYGRRAVAATMPWAFVFVVLAAVAIWILFQPMEMRGLGLGA